MKKRIKKLALRTAAALFVCAAAVSVNAEQVFAYNYARTGASQEGTVTIEAVAGSARANGYGAVTAYRVTYSITKDNWNAYDEQFGGYFFTGNQLNVSGGCHFAYHTSGGQIWEDGAMKMGGMSDATQIAKVGAVTGTVSCSFDAGSLDEIPAYIAYAYQPASSAYLHITEEYGNQNHIWYYQSLKDVTVQYGDTIDREAPTLTVSVVPTGNTVQVNGKIWSQTANIQAVSQDNKSRPGGIRIYQNGTQVAVLGNSANGTTLQTEYSVTANGSYAADSYDQLNNTCDKIGVSISCIDREAPSIQNLYLEDTGYARQTRLIAQASDSGCGLHETAYSWNGGAWNSESTYEVSENGAYTLKVRDALGNESTQTLTVSNIDGEAPELTVQVTPTGSVTTRDGVLWSTDAKLTAEATDLQSGVGEIAVLNSLGEVLEQVVSPAKEDSSQSADESLQLTWNELKNGSYKIRATDMLGNSTITEQKTYEHIDADAPVIREITQVQQEDGTVLLTITAEDEGIGLAKEAYSIDGGKTWQEDPTFTIAENGVYEIVVRDWLEQTAEQSEQVTDVEVKSDDDGSDDTDQSDGNGDGSDDTDQSDDNGDGSDDTDQSDGNGGDDSGNGNSQDGNDGNQGNNGGGNQNGGQGNNGSDQPGRGQNGTSTSATRKKGKLSQSSVSANDARKTGSGKLVTDQTVTEPEPDYSEAEEAEVLEITAADTGDTKNAKETNPAVKAVCIVLGTIFILGSLGLILYLLLFYFRYSCVLYGIGEEDKKHRLCRLSLRESGDDWYLTVPDQKLGICGTGRYLLVFHPSFAAEEKNESVIIDIDGKTLREQIAEEIVISI